MSAYVLWDTDKQTGEPGHIENEKMCEFLSLPSFREGVIAKVGLVVIERIRSYGQQVGNDTLETCEWVGRFEQAAKGVTLPVWKIPRSDVLKAFSIEKKGADRWLKECMVERFGMAHKRSKSGSLTVPGWSDHNFAALGVAVLAEERMTR
jgi:hypothetical protein